MGNRVSATVPLVRLLALAAVAMAAACAVDAAPAASKSVAAWVEAVPSPRLVLAVDVLARSLRLLLEESLVLRSVVRLVTADSAIPPVAILAVVTLPSVGVRWSDSLVSLVTTMLVLLMVAPPVKFLFPVIVSVPLK